ncbi:MAG: hypothetical protein U5K75_00040 [Ahrensia sp.]|nr:hypothetical protein [Ahrensia sp.]
MAISKAKSGIAVGLICALSDEGGGKTLASASEIAAREVQETARAHMGAYGGMIKEIMPVCAGPAPSKGY